MNAKPIIERGLVEDFTVTEFTQFVEQLAYDKGRSYEPPLETYLRSLLALVEENMAASASYRLFATLLEEAFTAQPFPFDPAWLAYTKPPAFFYDSSLPISYNDAKEMLLYQIADLHRMQQSGMLEDQDRYFGLNSPTNHRWYNFDPGSFLECASAGFVGSESDDCSWRDLAEFLWVGQIYE